MIRHNSSVYQPCVSEPVHVLYLWKLNVHIFIGYQLLR